MNTSDRRTTSRVVSHGDILHREFMLVAERPAMRRDRLTDISETGVSFTTPAAYEEGMLLEARLELTGWADFRSEFYYGDPARAAEPLVVILRVSTCRAESAGGQTRVHRVGCTYESADESHLEALRRYLDSRRRRAK